MTDQYNPMSLDAELKKRLLIYKSEVSAFYTGVFMWISILCFILSSVLLYGVITIAGLPLVIDWRLAIFINWLMLITPPYLLLHPKKPTMDDVKLDNEFKKLSEKIKNKY